MLRWLDSGGLNARGGASRPYGDERRLTPSLLKDLRVPLLRDVFREFPHMRMNVEMKHAEVSPAPALSRLIRECGMTDKVLVASFVGKFMTEFRALSPEVATSLSLSKGDLKKLFSGGRFSDDDPTDPRAIQMPYKLITEDVVTKARARNLKVHAWTVNDLETMYRMRTFGVDGIITDYPGPLMALLESARPA
ncbi:MAG: hypothetical protein LC746_11145 [Acidobacteria bacterium]|nr:hypothetical protein [Acidobacteriota bacterium]